MSSFSISSGVASGPIINGSILINGFVESIGFNPSLSSVFQGASVAMNKIDAENNSKRGSIANDRKKICTKVTHYTDNYGYKRLTIHGKCEKIKNLTIFINKPYNEKYHVMECKKFRRMIVQLQREIEKEEE